MGPDWGGYDYAYGYGYAGDGDGYVDTIPMSRDEGYFNTGGEVYAREGARPEYDYDRGYPYEWYRPTAGRSSVAGSSRRVAARHVSCSIEGSSVRVCRGQ